MALPPFGHTPVGHRLPVPRCALGRPCRPRPVISGRVMRGGHRSRRPMRPCESAERCRKAAEMKMNGLALIAVVVAAAAAAVRAGSLEKAVLSVVQSLPWGDIIDFGPFTDPVCPGAAFCPHPAPKMSYRPNIDVAVIALDPYSDKVVDVANIVLSRDYPSGRAVPLDSNMAATSVRFFKWDIDRYNGGEYDSKTGKLVRPKGWDSDPPRTSDDDLVRGREAAPLRFMAPFVCRLLLSVMMRWTDLV